MIPYPKYKTHPVVEYFKFKEKLRIAILCVQLQVRHEDILKKWKRRTGAKRSQGKT